MSEVFDVVLRLGRNSEWLKLNIRFTTDVVLTGFMSDPNEETLKFCEPRAEAEFEKVCVDLLRKVAPRLQFAKTSGLARSGVSSL